MLFLAIMDPRLVKTFVKRFHQQLARREVYYNADLHMYTIILHVRSRFYPGWFCREDFFRTASPLHGFAGQYVCENIQKQLCFEYGLNRILLKKITILPSRPIPVVGWDGHDPTTSFACAVTCWPLYLPLYCLPHYLLDVTRGREFSFVVHFTREELPNGQVIGVPKQLGGFVARVEENVS